MTVLIKVLYNLHVPVIPGGFVLQNGQLTRSRLSMWVMALHSVWRNKLLGF